MAEPCCGGHTAPKTPGPELDEITAPIMQEMKQRLNGAQNITFKSYTTQVVAGTNYRIHGDADGKPFTTLVFKCLPHEGKTPKITSIAFD